MNNLLEIKDIDYCIAVLRNLKSKVAIENNVTNVSRMIKDLFKTLELKDEWKTDDIKNLVLEYMSLYSPRRIEDSRIIKEI